MIESNDEALKPGQLTQRSRASADEPLIFSSQRRKGPLMNLISKQLSVLKGTLRQCSLHPDKVNAINDSVRRAPVMRAHSPSLARSFLTGEPVKMKFDTRLASPNHQRKELTA